jgi:hypothetical protein
MNYPLTWTHQFFRETACFLFGHKWKFSPTRHTKYFGMDNSEVPYAIRKITGNHMWESVAWWSCKCTRCRLKHRVDEGDAPSVWHVKQYYAIKDALRTVWWHLKYNFELSYGRRDFSLRMAVIEYVGPLFCLVSGLKQYLIHFDNLPWTWWTWLADLEWWYYRKLEK